MGLDLDEKEIRRRSEFLQALTTEHFTLQGARSSTVSESAARSSLYLSTLSSAVVALALVAQVSRFGQAFYIFALAVLAVIFFLGLVTYGRLLQSGVEDTIYSVAISQIRAFYSEIDPTRSHYFDEGYSERGGIYRVGLYKLRWQQFLAAAAMVAMVNSAVGGVFVALTVADFLAAPVWAAAAIGGFAGLGLAVAFLTHQRRAWSRVAATYQLRTTESS